MKRTSIIMATLGLGLALSVAPALANEVYVTDEWNQPVYETGAKGAKVQAMQKGHFKVNSVAQSASDTNFYDHFENPKVIWNKQETRNPEWNINGLRESEN
jgi:hypothetical protein